MALFISPVTSILPRNRHRLLSTHSSPTHHNRHPSNVIYAKASSSPRLKFPLQFSNVSNTKQGAIRCSGQDLQTNPMTTDGGERRDGNHNNHSNYNNEMSSIVNVDDGGVEEEKVSVSWFDRYFPKKLLPYAHLARWHNPIGIWLIGWPAFWSIALASASAGVWNLSSIVHEMKLLAVFAYGTVLLRGAVCTINDIFDRDFDKQVERSKSRPLPSGAVSVFQGCSFLGLQLLLWIPGFLLQVNPYSGILATCSLVLFFLYPLMKRITYWPTAFLAIPSNTGAIIGWSAMKGRIEPAIVFPLYMSGFFWTLVYDTIYTHQDKEDDVKAGVKSMALMFGDSTKKWISGFAVACIASLALVGYNAKIGPLFYPFLAAAAGHLAWQIITVDLSIPTDCGNKFRSNQWFGAIVFLGLLCGRL